ncbi:porin [Candidatus Hoaglandella endobia]|uniref:Outer membrane protein C n=1 Tax=Candidatus Hoaglandella endobia TaxID=1778263 RepID=A0A143WTQ8_9ENTR|nr:porin [Candidatus Hoaglandella endobia]CUX97130.1 Outer membrane protein C precursor [Candidatus Hoaglandella endobia]
MKLKYLAVFFLAILITDTTNAIELYNKYGNKLDFFGKLNSTRYTSGDNDQNGDRSFASLGFRGETQISDGLIGFGTWEQKILARHTENQGDQENITYLGFAGLQFGDIGSIDYGRNYGVLYDVGAWTDVMPELGGTTTINDNLISGRANGVFTYRNKNLFGVIDGLNFALQFQGKKDYTQNKGRSLREANGDVYGISVTYNLGNGVSTSAAYANGKRTVGQRSLHFGSLMENNSRKAQAYSLGLKYDVNNLYLAALYNETRNMTPVGKFTKDDWNHKFYGFAKKAKNIELVAQYQFDFGMRSSLGYTQSKISNNIESKKQDIKKYIELGASYSFNKNMLAFVDYRINLLAKDNFTKKAHISTNDIVALGMTYMF